MHASWSLPEDILSYKYLFAQVPTLMVFTNDNVTQLSSLSLYPPWESSFYPISLTIPSLLPLLYSLFEPSDDAPMWGSCSLPTFTGSYPFQVHLQLWLFVHSSFLEHYGFPATPFIFINCTSSVETITEPDLFICAKDSPPTVELLLHTKCPHFFHAWPSHRPDRATLWPGYRNPCKYVFWHYCVWPLPPIYPISMTLFPTLPFCQQSLLARQQIFADLRRAVQSFRHLKQDSPRIRIRTLDIIPLALQLPRTAPLELITQTLSPTASLSIWISLSTLNPTACCFLETLFQFFEQKHSSLHKRIPPLLTWNPSSLATIHQCPSPKMCLILKKARSHICFIQETNWNTVQYNHILTLFRFIIPQLLEKALAVLLPFSHTPLLLHPTQLLLLVIYWPFLLHWRPLSRTYQCLSSPSVNSLN